MAVPIIFRLMLQTVINVRMLSIGKRGMQKWTHANAADTMQYTMH